MVATAARTTLARTIIATPLGDMLALADDAGVRVLDFTDRRRIEEHASRLAARYEVEDAEHPHLAAAREALDAYLAGDAGPLAALAVAPLPAPTPFRARCWAYLRSIPSGQTRTYRQQAEALGDVNACRAVAGANAANFLSIVVPCHRVIGSDGSMTGYGGGESRKRWLIEHERRMVGGLSVR